MQVVAVGCSLSHTERNERKQQSTQDCSCFPLTYPYWICLAFWFVCLCRTLGKGSVRILYWLGCTAMFAAGQNQIQITCLVSALQDSLMMLDTLLNFRPHSPHWRNGLSLFASRGFWLLGVSEGTEETSGAGVQSAISGTAVWHLPKPWRAGVPLVWMRPQTERTQKRKR